MGGDQYASENGQKQAFLDGLNRFLLEKGKPLTKYPLLAGRRIDLHDLYNRVTTFGGFEKVTKDELWEDLLKAYSFPYSSSLSYGLQAIYKSYLEDYEKVHYFGEDMYSNQVGSNDLRRSYSAYQFTGQDLRYQSQVKRSYAVASRYDKVVLSLLSCLPNEVDFAVNSCTLLSGESRHVLKLPQCPKIIDALLMHAGMISVEFGNYRELLSYFCKNTGHNLVKFWLDSIEEKKVLKVLLPILFEEESTDVATPAVATPSISLDDTEVLMSCENSQSAIDVDIWQKNLDLLNKRKLKRNNSKKNLHQDVLISTFLDKVRTALEENLKNEIKDSSASLAKSWTHLFQTNRELGIRDYEGQRILQIALVLLNLSFEDFNAPLLANHQCFLQFVLLCVYSKYSCLRQTGLDILSNISSKIDITWVQHEVMVLIFDVIYKTTKSRDKFEIIRGFDILGNLAKENSNNSLVSTFTDDKVYKKSLILLLLQDVEIILAAIEVLYRLSKLGEIPCTKIVLVKNSIEILVYMVTMNVGLFGAERLKEIRIAKRIVPQATQPQQMPQGGSQPIPGQQQKPVYHPQMMQNKPMAPHMYPHIPNQAHLPHAHTAPNLRQTHPIPPQHLQHPNQRMPPLHQAPMVPQPPPINPAHHNVVPRVIPQTTLPAQNPSPQIKPTPTKVVQNHPKVSPVPIQPPAPQIQNTAPKPELPPKEEVKITTKVVPKTPTNSKPEAPPGTPVRNPATPKKHPDTPEGVGATYTHKETTASPPVFHYMPAPPSEIVLDSTAESFTKLWIWATYEVQTDNYIPRVDVYAEYVASSSRYGRHAKTEICSATEFGLCLKHVFPNASSRLFNQGRGHPQYHISGIKKRATPLPVPGHHIKDPVIITPPCSPLNKKRKSELSTSKLNVDIRTGEIIPAPISEADKNNVKLELSPNHLPQNCLVNGVNSTEHDTANNDTAMKCEKSVNGGNSEQKQITENGIKDNAEVETNKKPAIIDALMKMNGIISPEKEVGLNEINGFPVDLPAINKIIKETTPSPERKATIKSTPICNGNAESDATGPENEAVNETNSKPMTVNCSASVTSQSNTTVFVESGTKRKINTEIFDTNAKAQRTIVQQTTTKSIIPTVPTNPDILLQTPQKQIPQTPANIHKRPQFSQSASVPVSPAVKQTIIRHQVPIIPNQIMSSKAPSPGQSLQHTSTPAPPKPVTHQPPPQVLPQPALGTSYPTPAATQPAPGATQARQHGSKQNSIDLMAPNASLLVLMRNVGRIPVKNHLDDPEDPITKNIRLTSALILKNVARWSNLGRSLLQKYETDFANIAMSGMDCSPVIAKLLMELNT